MSKEIVQFSAGDFIILKHLSEASVNIRKVNLHYTGIFPYIGMSIMCCYATGFLSFYAFHHIVDTTLRVRGARLCN